MAKNILCRIRWSKDKEDLSEICRRIVKLKKLKKFLLILCLVLTSISCKAQSKYYIDKLSSHKEIAKLYITEGRYTDALKELEFAQKTMECDAETFNLLATVYMAKRNFEKAEQALKEALKRDPSYSEAYTNYGTLRMLQERYQEAIQYFEKALANPLYLNAHLAMTNMGWAYYQLGDKEKALNTLYSAVRENARATKALVYIALIYLHEGDLNSAEFYLKRVLRADRSSIEARYYLGEVFFRQGKIELAREIWESVVQLYPGTEWGNLAEDRLYLLKRMEHSK
ncbi:MAG: tetratricopeptide repeat protein [Caldimicrobium sp.]|nr:tetratricopeptide repeat protein [Caldimicrobium sp.]MCX7873059.1 tetratricopeptide repeat protein [Caldimicrobium sp.]MDW8094812.1 tetratricopeptide repeat protein [Caldimicrobium sp.]